MKKLQNQKDDFFRIVGFMNSDIYSEVEIANSDSESVSFSSDCSQSLSTIMNESNQKIFDNNRLQESNNNIKTDPDDIIIVGLPDVEEVHVFGADDPSY